MFNLSPKDLRIAKVIKMVMTIALALIGGVTFLVNLGATWYACLFLVALVVYMVAESILLLNTPPDAKDS
jgi:hypothetical protein